MGLDTDLTDLSVSAPTYDHGGTCATVALAGRARIEDAGWVRQLLELQAARGPGRIVIDLSRLSSMDWWAVLILLWAGQAVNRRGGALVLVSPQPAVARLLYAAGAAQALSRFHRPGVRRRVQGCYG